MDILLFFFHFIGKQTGGSDFGLECFITFWNAVAIGSEL